MTFKIKVNHPSVYLKSNLLDTGSTISTVSEQFYNNYLKDCELVTLDDLLEVTGVGGEKLPYLGYIAVDVTVSFI